jgi:hypothetical protein
MKVMFSVLEDFNSKTGESLGRFVYVSVLHFLFEDILFLVDIFPDTSFTCSITTEAMI